MDPHNDAAFCSRKASDYWGQVDLYIGGTEHAVGHLLYSRMWTKVLFDLGYIDHDEPYKRLVNQGMIQGSSRMIYIIDFRGHRIKDGGEVYFDTGNMAVSNNLIEDYINGGDVSVPKLFERLTQYSSSLKKINSEYSFTDASRVERRVDIKFVDGVILNINEFKEEKKEFSNIEFIYDESNGFICRPEVEKMSKSKFNVVNPDDLVDKYGADTFRMYEMFLGPVEQSKPWDTKGIEGVHRFLRKLWRLFFDEQKGKVWNEQKATDTELKVLHKAIKKIEEDTERFSFNTAVSAFMVCVNELTELKCNKKEILEPLLIMLAPYAPHVCEELWHELGNATTILDATYPKYEQKYTVESTKEYPVSINGKLRTTIVMNLNAPQDEIEKIVLTNDVVKKWTDEKPIKKFIFVKGKMVNVVV
jgi:leucyl-tRNA synthetase